MKKTKISRRLMAWILTLAVFVTTVFTGWTPVLADNTSGVTLTVIGDTGNHSADFSSHTGYIYWLKDYMLDVDLANMDGKTFGEVCGDKILAALTANGITYGEEYDTTTYYMNAMTKGEVTLDSTSGGCWSVIVAYDDGTFNSNGWTTDVLKAGCRLIYYWKDGGYTNTDCRETVDENYQTALNYETDAVTGVSLYTETEKDQAAANVSCEAGSTVNLTTKFTVPSASTVSRELTWSSSNEAVAMVTGTSAGASITAVSAGEADIKASMVNTLGDTVEAVCHVSVTAEGTTITEMTFEETAVSLEPGETKTLAPVFSPALAEGETAPVPSWTSSDETVVSVNQDGKVEALTPGTATVTAKITNNKGTAVTADCVITVTEIPVSSMTLDQEALDMTTAQTAELNVRFNPANATQIPEITWTSDDENVVTVAGEGTKATVTAVGGGVATITAAAGELTASCDVTVQVGKNSDFLESLVFTNNSAGATVYRMLEEIDMETKECTVLIPENVNSFYVKPVLAEGVSATIQAKYTNYNDVETTKDLTNDTATAISGTSRLFNVGQNGKDFTIFVTAGDVKEKYTVHVKRESLVSSLTMEEDNGTALVYSPSFAMTTREYAVTVADTVDSINLSFAAYNEESTVLTVNDETAENGNYTLVLQDGETKAVIKAYNENVVPAEYVLTVKRVTAGALTIATVPEDATVAVYDANNIRIWPGENGKYALLPDVVYSYVVSKTGYITQTGTVSGSDSLTITLKKAADSTLKQLDAEWAGFRKGEDNQGITSAETPVNSDETALIWEKQYGEGYSSSAVSSQILVDDKIYAYSGQNLLMIDKATGEVIKQTKMYATSSFAINPPAYADGMIFVGLRGGVQAFNAETLESLWYFADVLGGQPNSSIRYDNGYIYTGYWNSETKAANYVCVSVTDEDPTNPLETKVATWTYTVNGGFYWAGSYTTDKYVIVGTDDGTSGSTSDTSYVLVLDKNTGALVQKAGPCHGDIRSDITYYNGRIYFTSKGGYLYSYNLNADGTIDTENLIAPLQLGNMSTSTPVIYNNRCYVGTTFGSNFGGTYGIQVVDIDPETGAMSIAYTVNTDAYPQTSGTLSTAYVEETGYVYVYFLTNGASGNLYVVKDKAGMTEPAEETGIMFTPYHKQYCICSIVVDDDGVMYFKNDSAYLMAIKKNAAYITSVNAEGGNAVVDGGADFVGGVLNHEIVVDPGTTSVRLELEAVDDAVISMNGVEGAVQDIALADGKATVNVSLTKGEATGAYVFQIRERSQNAALEALCTTSANSYSAFLNLSPVFDSDVTEYYSAYSSGKTFLNIWPDAADSNASVTVTAVSGVKNAEEGDEITRTSLTSGHARYAIYFADTTYETPAKVKITVTAEDGVTTKDYYVTLAIDKEIPVLSADAASDRTSDTVDVTVTASEEGTLYYMAGTGEETVTVSDVTSQGLTASVEEGTQNLTLTDVNHEASVLYMVLCDVAKNKSDVVVVKLPEDTEAPVITDVTVDRKAAAANVTMTVSESGTGYYLVAASKPEADAIVENGTSFQVVSGENQVTVEGLTQSASVGYMVVVDAVGQISEIETLTFAKVESGWKQVSGKWYYYDEDGKLCTGFYTVKGVTYYSNADGVMQTGWVDVDGTWYCFDANGAMQTGWIVSKNKWYYMGTDGAMRTGFYTVKGVTYYSNSNGAMQTGWVDVDGTWYYFNASGAMQTGWIVSKNKWYYMGTDGAMRTGFYTVKGVTYYSNSNGAMQTGWVAVDGTWYYFNASGAMQTGWLKSGSKWYYLGTDGAMQTGFYTVKGATYYSNADGVMQTGWVAVDGTWYYFDGNGAMQTGWIKVSGKWYYLYEDGKMAADTWIDDCYVDASGVWVKSK